MATKDYSGSITMGGSERKIEVSANPLGRTTIRLDGITVFDKTPFVHGGNIEFPAVTDKKAVLHWQQTSLLERECAVTVDGKTSKLLPKGGPLSPADAVKRKLMEVRLGGLMAIGFGIMSLVINYYDLRTGHYWTTLGLEPVMILAGVSAILFPGKLRDLKGSRNLELAILAGSFVLCYVSHDLLLNWLSPR